jgi:hypothetical protein
MFWDLVRPPRVTLTRAPQCWPLSFFVGTSRRKTPPFNIDGRIQRYSARCQNVGLAFCFNGHFMFFRHRNFQTDTNFIHRVVGNCSFQIRLCFVFCCYFRFLCWFPLSEYGVCWPCAVFGGFFFFFFLLFFFTRRLSCLRCPLIVVGLLRSTQRWQAIQETAWCAPPCPTNRQSYTQKHSHANRETNGWIDKAGHGGIIENIIFFWCCLEHVFIPLCTYVQPYGRTRKCK